MQLLSSLHAYPILRAVLSGTGSLTEQPGDPRYLSSHMRAANDISRCKVPALYEQALFPFAHAYLEVSKQKLE